MVGSGRWTWTEAFRRCSSLPAEVLGFAPAARAKGHLGIGADADIVVLDPATFADTATYTDPTSLSVGVRHLLVHGTPVIRGGQLDLRARPGRPVRAEHDREHTRQHEHDSEEQQRPPGLVTVAEGRSGNTAP